MGSHHTGSEEEQRALSAFINLMRATESISARLCDKLEDYSLTPAQFGILETLMHLGAMSEGELLRKAIKGGPHVAQVIDNLEKRGWAKRERNETDRRSLVVNLTLEGRKMMQRVFPKIAAQITTEMNSISPAEQDTLRILCRSLGKQTLSTEAAKSRELRPGKEKPKIVIKKDSSLR